MADKPHNPYPPVIRKLLRTILPNAICRRYVGRHEDESMRQWVHISAQVRPDEAILDIGAFKGVYALAARAVNFESAIYAFEPNPHSAKTLYQLCQNRNIEVSELAVAEAEGSISFLLNSAMSRIANFKTELHSDIVKVPATTLDSWVAENNVIPSLLKIDTEGAEAGILRGAQLLLKQHQPIILCEVLSDSAGNDVMAALPRNFLFFHIDENSGIEERSRITRKVWRNRNWLLVPKHRKAEVYIYH